MTEYPNLYFDYLIEMNGAKSIDDAQNIFWWLLQKHKPKFNSASVSPSTPAETFEVTWPRPSAKREPSQCWDIIPM